MGSASVKPTNDKYHYIIYPYPQPIIYSPVIPPPPPQPRDIVRETSDMPVLSRLPPEQREDFITQYKQSLDDKSYNEVERLRLDIQGKIYTINMKSRMNGRRKTRAEEEKLLQLYQQMSIVEDSLAHRPI